MSFDPDRVPQYDGTPVVHYYAGVVENGVLVRVMPHTRSLRRERAEQWVEEAKEWFPGRENHHWVLVTGTSTFEVV